MGFRENLLKKIEIMHLADTVIRSINPIDGTRRILDIVPDSIHQRTPLVIGSRVELADFERFVAT